MPQISLNLDRDEKELVFGLLDYLKTDTPCHAKYKREFMNNLFSESNRDLSRVLLFPYVIVDGCYLDLEFVQKQIIDPYQFIYSPTALVTFLNHLGALNVRGKSCTYNQIGKWKLLNYHNRSVGLNTRIKSDYENQMLNAFHDGLLENLKQLIKSICILQPNNSGKKWS